MPFVKTLPEALAAASGKLQEIATAAASQHTGAVTTMPSAASAGRGGAGFGAPHYRVKPKVMPLLPHPTIT